MAAADSRTNANHGAVIGGQRVGVGRGGAMKFDSSFAEHVSVPSSPCAANYRQHNDCDVAESGVIGHRQTPWDKAYGGEGAMTFWRRREP